MRVGVVERLMFTMIQVEHLLLILTLNETKLLLGGLFLVET